MPAALTHLDIAGESVPVRVRVNRRARRLLLRIDPKTREVVLTLPHQRLVGDGLAFASSRAEWLAARFAELPNRIPFADGGWVPLLGEPHRIRHRPGVGGGVRCVGDEIHVAGDVEFLPRRVGDWLRREAKREAGDRSLPLAERIGRRVRRVTVRDNTSRWGSCSADGSLSFCWRLILAPAPVLDYVVAHEVAHLVHRNHGQDFWSLVAELCPDHVGRREWLRAHGAGLHRFG
jgi:predicted metal-dependent hydrolase